jgi:hypothetical protein
LVPAKPPTQNRVSGVFGAVTLGDHGAVQLRRGGAT